MADCPRCEWPRYQYVDDDGFVFEACNVGKTISGGIEYDDCFVGRVSDFGDKDRYHVRDGVTKPTRC